MVTTFEEFRNLWEPLFWFIKPERRFVCDNRAASLLASAAAILSVAASSPSSIVTILPSRCRVTHEWILRRAIDNALDELPSVPEGAVTLGMLDVEEGIDEDYLLVGRPRVGGGLSVDGFARRPVSWAARHLRHSGALVASGIMIGYAGVFAAHISKNWPGISRALSHLASTAATLGEECEIPCSLNRGVPPAVLHSLRWHPPAFPQRVFSVCNSGWSGLKSPQAVAREVEFISIANKSDVVGESPVPKSMLAAHRGLEGGYGRRAETVFRD